MLANAINKSIAVSTGLIDLPRTELVPVPGRCPRLQQGINLRRD